MSVKELKQNCYRNSDKQLFPICPFQKKRERKKTNILLITVTAAAAVVGPLNTPLVIKPP